MTDERLNEIIVKLNDMTTREGADIYEFDELLGLIAPELQTLIFVCPKCQTFNSYMDAASDDDDTWCLRCVSDENPYNN